MKNNKKLLIAILVILAIIILPLGGNILYRFIKIDMAQNAPYLYINGKTVSKVEYDYYYYSYYNSYIAEYSSLFSYMNVNADEDLLKQQYDDNRTFEQYFNDCAVDQIIKIQALNDDGLANGFEYDVDADYDEFLSIIKETCDSANVSLNTYFKQFYGEYASEKKIKPLLKYGFYATAYYTYLCDTMNKDENDLTAFYYTGKLKDKYEIKYP